MTGYVRDLRELVGARRLILPDVRAIIPNGRGEVLLQRRTDMPLWGLPSGSLELEESALEALRREVREETTLDVLAAEPIALYSGRGQDLAYPNGDRIQCVAVVFIVRRWEGAPSADGVEGSALRFFGLDELPEDLVPLHRQTLEDYSRYAGKFMLG